MSMTAPNTMTAPAARFRLRPVLNNILLYGLLILVAVAIGLPVIWLILSSFKTQTEYMAYPVKFFPPVLRWRNYIAAMTLIAFWKYAAQSAYLACVFSFACVLSSSLAGFAFSRLYAPARNALFSVVLALLIVPGIVFVIPQFLVFSRLRLVNTYWPWLLWGLSGSSFHIFLFRQFFATIPAQLEDAAEVDGCGDFRIYWQIFLPNSKPVLATSLIFNLSYIWGDWFYPLIYLDDEKTTLSVKLTHGYVTNQGFPDTMAILAASVLYVIPLVVLFFIGQKYIIQGVVTSGIKG
jgi:multiple sugar transport system permease protein